MYFVKVTIKTFRHVHPDRRWKAYEWKINFAQLLDEILTVFNNILSDIEVSKFEILFKPEIISKHHHTCFYIFLLIFVTLNSVLLCFPKIELCSYILVLNELLTILVIFKIVVILFFFFKRPKI